MEAFLGTENIWGMKEGEQIKLANAVKAIRNAKIDKQSTSELNTTGLQYTGSDFEKIAIESADKNLADSFGFKNTDLSKPGRTGSNFRCRCSLPK